LQVNLFRKSRTGSNLIGLRMNDKRTEQKDNACKDCDVSAAPIAATAIGYPCHLSSLLPRRLPQRDSCPVPRSERGNLLGF